MSTPGSASFHQYLSPKAYAARFGAPAAEAASVESWLRSAGFTGVKASPLRSYVRATGAASVIDAAFHTTLRRYHATAAVNAGPYQLRANGTPVSVPASLSGKVLGVTGLDNAAPLLPLQRRSATAIGKKTPPLAANKVKSVPCSYYYGEHVATACPGSSAPRRSRRTTAATAAPSSGRRTGPPPRTPAPARRPPWWNWA